MPRRRPTYGDKIRRARVRLGWSKSELARAVGVSQPTIGRVERNELVPKPHLSFVLALFLDIPFLDLENTPAMQDMVQRFARLAAKLQARK